GARASSWLADAGSPEATDESLAKKADAFVRSPGPASAENFIHATERLFSPSKTAGKTSACVIIG
ncbi:MAG: hypothetical protein ACYDCX_13550, partial [Acidithiobacillus sp.]